MKNFTKYMALAIAGATAILQIPSVQTGLAGLLSAHPSIAAVVAGLAAISALVHNPKAS